MVSGDMVNQNSDDWLPPGWTVKVRVRKSGKRDKYYFAPSSQLRFNSRAEVSRYLKTPEKVPSKSEENDASKQTGNNVEIKKDIGEGLPPGWIKEVRVTKTANKIRRDSYYIDPINGNVLRSMKDVHRYLTTGKVRRFAFKPRNDKNRNVEFERDDIPLSALKSSVASKKEMLAVGKARRQIIWGRASLEPGQIPKDGAIFETAKSVGESTPLSEPHSGHGEKGTELHCVNRPEVKDSEQSDGKNDSSLDKPVSHKYTMEKRPTKNESKKRQKKTTDTNIPHRASKRLAGLQADPMLEIKTCRRARPVACKESDKQVASTIVEASQCPLKLEVKHETKSTIDPLKGIEISRVSGVNSFTLPVEVKKVKSEDAREPPKCSLLPLGKQDGPGKHVGTVESEDKTDVKQGPILKLPFEELLTDPCIAFAIKTLTEEVFDSSISSKASPVPNNIEHVSPIFATRDEERLSKPENKPDEKEKQGSSTTLPSQNLPVVEVGKVGDGDVEKLGATIELPVGEILADPCIEFAIKTLTGEIPLDSENYFQQQVSSSKSHGTTADDSNNFLSQQFCAVEKRPVQAFEALPNVNFQSFGTGMHQQEGNRNNGLQR